MPVKGYLLSLDGDSSAVVCHSNYVVKHRSFWFVPVACVGSGNVNGADSASQVPIY